MTANERRARRLFKWAVDHFSGDLQALELALRAQVKAGSHLPKVSNAQRDAGAPLRPYRGGA